MIKKLFLSAFFCCLLSGMTFAAAAIGLLEWKISSPKNAIFQGEPLLLNVELKNKGAKDIVFDFGADGIGVFSLSLMDENGRIIQKGSAVEAENGFYPVRSETIKAGGLIKKSIVANRLINTNVSPGNYTIMCGVNSNMTKENGERIKISIVGADHEKLAQILSDFEKTAFRDFRNMKNVSASDIKQRKLAMEMLGFADSPLALKMQIEILKKSYSDSATREKIIDKLAGSGRPDVAVEFVRLANDESLVKRWPLPAVKGTPPRIIVDNGMRDNIIKAIHEMRKSGNKKIMEITSDFVKNHPETHK